MSEESDVMKCTRKVTPAERFFARSPHAIVTIVARIKGKVTESMLNSAVSKAQRRHPNLRVRICGDQEGGLWFTSEGVQEIPITIVPRESDDQWIKVVEETSRVPFEFERRPAIRFILVQSPTKSELVIVCHHIICDGLSLAYLARDIMEHLGDPDREVNVLSDPVIVNRRSIPEDVSLNPIVKFFINRMNKKWKQEKILFDQEDYLDLNAAYWKRFTHHVICIELSEAQTGALVDRCREEDVSVNSALTAAFFAAQFNIQDEKAFNPNIVIAASLRERLQTSVGEVMGVYAWGITLKHKYNPEVGFWENARRFHRKVKPLFTDKNLFNDPLTWLHLDPTILESIHFKRLGGLVPKHADRYQKLSEFSNREDVVSSILKRDNMDSLETVSIGTAVTNLTRLDFPVTYGALELDRLIMKPGGGFPLVTVNLVLGAVTCSGKLSLIVEYAEEAVDTSTMEKIIDKAMAFYGVNSMGLTPNAR